MNSRPSFVALASETVAAYRAGAPDANGSKPERHISDGDGNPCRHCLEDIAEGEPFLILAHRPFPSAQPYAETGPIFVHAEPCERYGESAALPPIVRSRERVMIRGYDRSDRIVYGTGKAVSPAELIAAATELFARNEIAYIHVRSATSTCFQCRIDRAPTL